jgi:hypothetical protein
MPSSLKEAAETLQNLSLARGLDLLAYREEHVSERVSRALEREAIQDARELARLLGSDDHARDRFRRSVAMVVTGLDLLLELVAKTIVEGHGGSIGVSSTEGVGTTFEIELPLLATADAVASGVSPT